MKSDSRDSQYLRPRTSYTGMTSTRLTTVLEARRERSACAPFGRRHVLPPTHPITRQSMGRTIEALTRAGEFDKSMLAKAVTMFEEFLQYPNHVGLCTEEISTSGEGLGNAVQGFT